MQYYMDMDMDILTGKKCSTITNALMTFQWQAQSGH
jgi:hypothetical protein